MYITAQSSPNAAISTQLGARQVFFERRLWLLGPHPKRLMGGRGLQAARLSALLASTDALSQRGFWVGCILKGGWGMLVLASVQGSM